MLTVQSMFRPSSGLLCAASLALLAACSGGSAAQPGQASAQGAAAQQPAAQQPAAQRPAAHQPGQASAVAPAPAAAATAPTAQGGQAQPVAHTAEDGHGHAQPAPSALLAGEMPKDGRLKADQPEHDFGTAIEGEVLSHTFALKSNGAGALMIMSAKPTCGCTVGTLEVSKEGEWKPYTFGDKVPPGTDLRLTATLDTKNKKSIAASKIQIFCNDPRGTVTLALTAKLDTYFNVAPNNVDFGEISVADAVSRRIEITAKQPGAFLLSLDDRQLPQGFRAALEPVAPDADGRASRWTLQVDLGPDAQEGPLGIPVALQSDREILGAHANADGTMPRYSVTVMVGARVRGLVSFEPQYLSFGLVRPGQVVSRTFGLKSYDPDFSFPTDLKVRFAGPNENQPDFRWADYFSSTIRPSEDGKGVDVELTMNGLPEEADGSFQGRAYLATGHPSKPEISVLFSGVCRAGVGAAIPGVQVRKAEPGETGGH